MIKDRGNMKWTAMMLPEHLVKIREWKQDAYTEAPRSLSEWELEDIQQTIDHAFGQHKDITLTVWEGSGYVEWSGIINAIDNERKVIILNTLLKMKHVSINTVHGVRLNDEYYE
ncbi:YolD-like family protein [Lysinibacillus xylanilyticus]|uniref:YolD-like family protein n=1 Tax=Lysinibacillus xylanilyticus TaxID=582475 RepID=UPI002B250CDC|nr:YolD-like family protein [Lysinibacillus xylanilyticus]MEB2279650.1 YolD-like family protein [Lysinibacillus xylanilyticus]